MYAFPVMEHERAPTFLVDVTRMLGRLHHSTPRGIDRVLLEYALHFDALSDRVAFCASVAGDWYWLPPSLVRPLLAELAGRWFGSRDPGCRLGAALCRALRRPRVRTAALRALARRLTPRALPSGPIVYLNVSHKAWTELRALRATLPGRDLRIVAMVHDLMPLTCGPYFTPELREEFRLGFDQLARESDLILTNSDHTAREVKGWLLERGRRAPRVLHIALAARVGEAAAAEPRGRPSFVHLGAIETRKNISLLVAVWRALADRDDGVPTLHLIGPSGDFSLARVDGLRDHVRVHHGLDDLAVGRLLVGARALLLPSLAEGFGLPVVEALGRGVPAIASNLPAVREHAGGIAELLPSGDIPAWVEAVADYSRPGSQRRRAQLDRIRGYRAPTWPDHFAALEREIAQELDTPAVALSAG